MKKKKRSIVPVIFILSCVFGLFLKSAIARVQDEEPVIEKGIENSVFVEENEQCLKCHGNKFFTLKDESTGKELRQNMCSDYKIESEKFYHSVHWSFSCLDCHAEEYNTFPHARELRFAEYWTCMDCHGYDDNFSKFQFEEIDSEHQKSIHYTALNGDFSCWNCHDPHSYQLLSRSDESIADIVLKSNNICLECHGNEEKFQLVSERDLGNIVPKHSWLPNQSLHFKSVRCIECHSSMNDSILVAHNILPAEKAVKNCVECHSRNSILMGSLYKWRAQQSREKSGFVNGVIINNESYVIGANRSIFMNIASLVLFGLVIAVIAIHVLMRIIIKKH